MTKQSAGRGGRCNPPNYFQLQLVQQNYTMQYIIDALTIDVLPVTGPLCTSVIHHRFLPVSALFSLHLYPLQMSSQDAACLSRQNRPFHTILHGGARVFAQTKQLGIWALHSDR